MRATKIPDPSATAHERPVTHRLLYIILGVAFVVLGVFGIVLPLLPTTPFILLAAACFARSSHRLHTWLLESRVFGATIRRWEESRTISRAAKRNAIALIVLTLGTTVAFFAPYYWVRGALIVIGAAVISYIVRIPSER